MASALMTSGLGGLLRGAHLRPALTLSTEQLRARNIEVSDVAKQQRRVQRVYSLVAGIYDLRVGTFLRWRKPAVEALRPQPGDTVLDLACGTGLNFPHVVERIGLSGRLVGVDSTRPMLKRARRRVAKRHWDNVTLLEGDATRLPFDSESFDGVICSYAMAIIPD